MRLIIGASVGAKRSFDDFDSHWYLKVTFRRDFYELKMNPFP